MPFTVFNIQDGGREGGREGRERAGKEKRKRERRNTMLKDDKLSSGSSPGPGFLASSHCSPNSRHRDSLAHPDGTKSAPLLLFPLPNDLFPQIFPSLGPLILQSHVNSMSSTGSAVPSNGQ